MSSLTLTTFLLAVVEDRCQCVGDSGDDDQHGDLQIRCRGCPAGENRLKCKSMKENLRTKQTKTVLHYKGTTHDFTQI